MEILDDNLKSDSGLQFTTSLSNSLNQQAYWARFIGMTSMVIIGILILMMLIMGSTFLSVLGSSSGMAPEMGGMGMFLIVFYCLVFAFVGYISFLLWDFGRKVKLALNNHDQDMLEMGSSKLATYFKIYGILTAIVVVLYALVFVFALIAGGASMMR